MPQCSCGVGFGEFAGCTVLSITIGVPFFSLTWPLVTTCWPSFRPLRMATWSPRVSPVVTKACCTTRPEPDAAGAGAEAAPPARDVKVWGPTPAFYALLRGQTRNYAQIFERGHISGHGVIGHDLAQ